MSAPVLVLNPVSGGLPDRDAADQLAGAARKAVPGLLVRVTERAGDARTFGRRAREDGAGQILVAGGDGTVNEVIRGLLEGAGSEGGGGPAMPTLNLLPVGTGNDLARCLELPLDWEATLSLAARRGGRVLELDLMEVTLDGEVEVAANAVVIGSGGRVGRVLDPEEKKRWGPLSYLRSAAEVALQLEPVEVEMWLDDDDPLRLEVLNVVAANGRYAARGIPIAPGADPADGRLELVWVRDAKVGELLAMAPALLREADPEHDVYRHRHLTTARIQAVGDDPLPVSVDGENTQAREVRVRLLGDRIPVRVPTE